MLKNIFKTLLLLTVFVFAAQSCSDDDELANLSLSTEEIVFGDYKKGVQTFTLESNTNWEINVDSENKWLKVNKERGLAGRFFISIIVDNENNTDVDRLANLIVKTKKSIKEIKVKQMGAASINLSEEELVIEKEEVITFTLQAEDDWIISIPESWCDVSPKSGSAGTHTITITPKSQNEEVVVRRLTLKATVPGNSASLIITQAAADTYKDGDVLEIQTATRGVGIDLIFMADGFTKKDLAAHGIGKYEKSIRAAVEAFFDIEPYTTYRDYFNVYMVVAESKEEGVSDTKVTKNTALKTKFTDGSGGFTTACDNDLVKKYVKLISKLKGRTITDVDLRSMTTIVALNDTRYSGTTYVWDTGFSIALCSMSTQSGTYGFANLVMHEAGGHGFGRLADEYIGNGNTEVTIPQTQIDRLINNQNWAVKYGLNVTVSTDPSEIPWTDFIGLAKYPYIGLYEGAFNYGKGVWRSEENSCMIYNIKYFNTISRWLITKRILELGRESVLTLEDFVAKDNVTPISIRKSVGFEKQPLSPPVYVIE